MNTGGPNRPSLVAGSAPAAQPAGRILADMENRKPQASMQAAGRRRLPWILVLGCLILVAFLVVLRWPGMPASGAGSEFADDGTVGQPLPATQGTIERPRDAQPQGAVIIDDPAMAETRSALESLPSADDAPAATDDARIASAPTRQSRSNATRRRTAARKAAKKPETDLFSTLMQIIKQDEPAGDKAKTAQPSSMDALIAQIEAEDNRNRSENQAALASLGGESGGTTTPVRSPDVQQELRACPRANTVAGIECRRRVCAEHAGDAACPRQ